MKCDNCKVKKCETRDVLKKFTNPMLEKIIERECTEYKPKEVSDDGNE